MGAGHPNRRAQITIALFALDEREELRRERAELIVAIWFVLVALESDPRDANKNRAARAIKLWSCSAPGVRPSAVILPRASNLH